MGENGWFTESSQNPNPTIEFVISNVNDIEAHYADVLKLDAADSAPAGSPLPGRFSHPILEVPLC